MNLHSSLCAMCAAMLCAGTVRAAEAPAADFKRPGVTAHRSPREVRIEARATGLAAFEPCEFVLIGPNSGHGYEALAVSAAKPSDVHAALEFIGLTPGRTADSRTLQFWPRGPRVSARIERRASNGALDSFPVERAVINRRTREALPEEGFMFTGSQRLRDPELGPDEIYAADLVEPCALISLFNQAGTVMDIPRSGTQGELYDVQAVHPDRVMAKDEPIVVVVTPADPARGWREPLVVETWAGVGADGGAAFRLPALPDMAGVTGTVQQVRSALTALAEKRLVYLRVAFERDLPASRASLPAAEVERWVGENMVRLDAPDDGHLVPRAFLPQPAFRERGERPSHPLELRFERKDGDWSVVVTQVTPDVDSLTRERVFLTEDWTAKTPAELASLVQTHGVRLPVLLVFTPGDTPCGTLADWLAPLRPSHPVVHIFTE